MSHFKMKQTFTDIFTLFYQNVTIFPSRESCLAVKELLCFNQWIQIANKVNMRNPSHHYRLPDCDSLPSKYGNHTECIDAELFRKDPALASSTYIL